MRVMWICLVGAAAVSLVSLEAFAAKWDGSKAYQACIGDAKDIDSAMAACGQDEFDRQDKLLNAAYAARLKASEGKLKQAIIKAQKAWLAARDPTCDAESAVYDGGTLEPVAYTSCEARLTIERIEWLKSLDQ